MLRYGNARDLCLGLEAVLPDGRLAWPDPPAQKQHRLRSAQPVIGAEAPRRDHRRGLKLYARLPAVAPHSMVVESPAATVALLSLARHERNDQRFRIDAPKRFRFQRNLPNVTNTAETRNGRPDRHRTPEIDTDAALEALFAAALDAGLVSDGLIAQNAQQAQDFWTIRETIPEANRLIGSVSSHDISVPLGTIPEFITRATDALLALGDFRINCFGHVGEQPALQRLPQRAKPR